MEGLALERRHLGSGGAFADALRAPGPGGWLMALLLACCAYAVFAGGATAIPAESRVQVGAAAALLLGGLGVATGALGMARSPLAWIGTGLLAAFAVWSAIGVSWSIESDTGWLAANRAATYAVVVAAALVAAPSVRAAPVLFAVGFIAVALVAAVYALCGKLIPQVSLGPIDFDHANRFTRLREPLGYWNALGLLLVMATPTCIWLAVSERAHRGIRIAAALALQLLVVTIALTYSRGALIAYATVVLVMVAAGPRRLGRLAVGIGVPLSAAPAIAFAFSRADLSTNLIPAGERADDGAVLALAIAGSMIALAGAASLVLRWERHTRWGPAQSRLAWQAILVCAVMGLFGGLGGLAASEGGLTSRISEEWDQFRRPARAPSDPSRLISSSSSNRWIWWREATGAWSDKPIIGWGTGSFPTLHTLYKEHPSQVHSAHSVPLQFLAENGLLGFALVASGLALLVAAAVATIRRARGPTREARIALVAAFAAWAVHGLYDWDWEIPAVTLVALLALAIAAAPPARRRPSAFDGEEEPRTRPTRVAVLTAVLAAALAISVALPALSQDARLSAQVAAAEGGADGLEQARVDAALARRLNPLSVDALRVQAYVERQAGRLERTEELLVEATQLQPHNARVWQQLAPLETLLGNPQIAGLAMRRFAESSPLASRRFSSQLKLGALIFVFSVPPAFSPTAYGTPP